MKPFGWIGQANLTFHANNYFTQVQPFTHSWSALTTNPYIAKHRSQHNIRRSFNATLFQQLYPWNFQLSWILQLDCNNLSSSSVLSFNLSHAMISPSLNKCPNHTRGAISVVADWGPASLNKLGMSNSGVSRTSIEPFDDQSDWRKQKLNQLGGGGRRWRSIKCQTGTCLVWVCTSNLVNFDFETSVLKSTI